jgi:hypothetical protein
MNVVDRRIDMLSTYFFNLGTFYQVTGAEAAERVYQGLAFVTDLIDLLT